MKWIDILKNMFAKRGKHKTGLITFTDSNGFPYDCYFSNEHVAIFINNSDSGYEFDYVGGNIIWSRPDGAEGLFSDEVRNHLKDLLKE